ncbi:MAG: glycine-rich protein, partial [Myxococcota bacterium]|nr:glycine-rich protein [Myxococcota bacterium]
LAACGDGHRFEGQEACDDANQQQDDACLNDCSLAACGDGHRFEGQEACDDGNQVDDDGCSNACIAAACDDQVLNQGETETDCGGPCPACAPAFDNGVFSPCGQTGASGPSQAQCNATYAATDLAGAVTLSDGIQRWTVPATGNYRIEAWGAEGGDHGSYGPGGLGARMRGDFVLQQGLVLKILVGQEGKDGSNYDTGGGGGSFVAHNDNTPLIVAAGGATAGNCGNTQPRDRRNGKASIGNGSGGTSGNQGGWCGCGGEGSAGGGFTGDGGGSGGLSFINGGTGDTGRRPGQCVDAGWGGFGGGGNGGNGGGGGGGYQGGNAGGPDAKDGAGGQSYNSGQNQSNSPGVQSGSGRIVIIGI